MKMQMCNSNQCKKSGAIFLEFTLTTQKSGMEMVSIIFISSFFYFYGLGIFWVGYCSWQDFTKILFFIWCVCLGHEHTPFFKTMLDLSWVFRTWCLSVSAYAYIVFPCVAYYVGQPFILYINNSIKKIVKPWVAL